MATRTFHQPTHTYHHCHQQQISVFPALPQEDPLRPARGVLLGAISGAMIWAVLIGGTLRLLGHLP